MEIGLSSQRSVCPGRNSHTLRLSYHRLPYHDAQKVVVEMSLGPKVGDIAHRSLTQRSDHRGVLRLGKYHVSIRGISRSKARRIFG